MNEQAIIDSYNLFVQNGYKKSLQDYKQLISSNPDALNDSYGLFRQNGYAKSLDDYKALVGVGAASSSPSSLVQQPTELKKKEDTTGLPSEDGSLVSSKSVKPEMAQFGYQPGKPLPKPIPSVQPDQPKYTEEVMFGPMGISGVKTTGEAPEFQGKSIPKVVGEIGKVLAKGAVKFPAGVLETAAIATAAARNLAAKTGIVDETSALDISVPIGGANINFYQAAGEWKDLVNDFVPTDKDIESGFWGQTANALGEMIPILLTGAISGGARAIAKEAGKKGLSMQAVANYGKNVVSRIGTPQGVLTISQVAAPSYEQAKLEGATENEALGYAIQNAVMTFPLEMLPVNNLFKRLDNVLVGNTGVEVLKRAVVGGGEEFITEGVQAVYENVTADAIYGTTRGFLDGVGESAAVGGTVGAIMNGVLTALLGRRARATSAKEIEEIDKSITDVEQKIAQVDSNNESLKETVKVLEETKPRVLSYGSANYNFIESPEGALEYADDALTEEQAQGIIGNLTNSYKKIDFQIEEVEPDDPYQPTTYKIIGKPKAIQQEAVVESGLTPIERTQQIETLELELKADDNIFKRGGDALNYIERLTLEEELQTLKSEEDAFQKQAAGQVPVQPGATISEEVAQGEPQAEPQGIAEEGVQEEVSIGSRLDVNAWGSDGGLTNNFYTTDIDGYAVKKPLTNLASVTIDGIDFHIAKVEGDWKVIEKESGLEISTGKITNTKKAAIEDATIRLAQNGGAANLPTLISRVIQGFKDRNVKTLEKSLETQPAVSQTVAPTPVPVEEAPAPVVEAVTPEPTQEETFEQIMDRVRKEVGVIELEVKDFNSKNDREYTGRKDKYEIEDDIIKADRDVFYSQRDIGSADDVEAAINEYNKAKEKVSELKEEINQIDNFKKVDSFIFDEIQNSKKPDYEYNELFKQDPRLATIQSYNDSIDFLKTLEGEEESISEYERDIKILNEDIKKYPIKKQVSKPVAKTKAAPKPTVKKPKAETKRQEIISRPAFTPITLARQWLLSGGKLRSTQSEENKRRDVGVGKGVREETGMGGVEMRQLIRVIDNKKGVSPEVAAERIYENLSPELQASMDVQDIRDSIIEVLLSEDRKSWIDNQDRETSEESQESELDRYMYEQLTDEERADFDEYEQRENYYNYLSQNAKRLAKEYDAYIKSQTYQDYIEEVYERDREGQIDAQDKNDGRGQEQGTDAGATPVQGQAAKAPEVDTVINEETGTLESALDFLDGIDKTIAKTLKTRANDVLLGIPLTVVQGMVKGLKVLVQGGMKLRDAIKKIAADNNISQDKLKDLLDLGAIAQDFNDLMAKADKLIARQKARGIEDKKIVSNLDAMVRKADVYINANDAQRKIMEREARAKMGVEARKAASIGRVIGVLKDITNVTREEKLNIISRIRELGRDVAKDLASEIREMAKGGTITPNQAANIISKFGKVNMLNEMSVSNFVDYMAKVFADAEYTNQLSDAASKRKSLRSLSKNKDKAANLRSLASKFIEIDPSMVDDIYEYNRIARLIDESIKGSSIRGKDVRFASIVQEGTVIPYINKTLETQREKLYEERLKEVSDILGVDAEGLSYEDLLTLLSEPKTKGKDNEKVVRDAINKAFEIYSSIINSSIETGIDPISGEKVSYTDSQKKLISQFMNMDLGLLSPKQALEAVDGLLNFIQNNSTAKMEAILKGYTGVKNAAELVKKGVKSSPLRKYFSQGLGRFFGEQTTNLGLLFERLFKGFEAGGVVQDAMGLTDLINGKSKAQIESNRIINDYVNEFYKKKANGEAFNTELNNVERGMAAWMMRNIIGTEAEMKAEFQRRKDLILKVDNNGNRTGSIAELENGNDKEQAKAKVYQEVYDKILDGAEMIEDVMSKVDAVNLEAVKFWQDQWQNKYDELADVSLNVYNKVLEKDINYTPDKYGKLSTSSGAVEITENDMAFHVNNGTLYNKEAGVLMEATRPEALPVDNTTGEVDRYIDLSFDSNNANSMYDALVDIKTAGPIRQVQAFLNSKSFKKIFPQAEDATILKGGGRSKRIGRIELFTRNFRNKNPYSEDEFSNAVRNLNRLANVGVSQALGGVFQPIKQVVPVGINTLINGGGLDVDAMTNPAKIKFMMDSGFAIGFRGVESQAQVESLNKLMDMAAKSKGEKAMKYIEEANKIWLKIFLVKPDVFIARASWMTYYEQSLQKQGIDTNGIDYNTHELNEKAANYAQRMVDRQQNVSDADLSGKLFAEKNPGKQIMMKVFMPFASFRMNQSARIGSDIATLTSKVSTEEDRGIAARSLAGFTVEMATFRALSLGISLLTAGVVAKMMGADEEDEEKKKNSIIKGQATNIISDVLSPIPFADPFVQAIAATTLQGAQDIAGVEEENALSIYSPQDKGYLEQIGLFGFAAQRVIQTGELIWLSSVGNYRDNFGKKKYISPEDQEALRLLIGPALLTNVGLAPSEMNSVVRASMSAAKKNSSTKEGGPAGKDYESEMIDRIEEDLLEGYENKSELKRYNPRLYEQNFGKGSEYYELTKEKKEEQKKAREEEQKEKDAEYGYKGKSKGFGSRSKSSGGGFGAKKFGED